MSIQPKQRCNWSMKTRLLPHCLRLYGPYWSIVQRYQKPYNFPGPVLANQRRLPGPRRRGLHIAESAEGYRAEQAPPGTAEVIASLRPLAQLQQAVILAEAPDGSLYLVDQHRAHERVIYEHLRHTSAGAQNDEAD